MDYVKLIANRWRQEVNAFQADAPVKLDPTTMKLGNYRSYLLETFYHTRENPFSQVMAAAKIGRHQHDVFRKFVQHALSEVKHDLLAANDFLLLGGDKSMLESLSPLPATQDLINFTYEIADADSVVPYLGYLYHVENLPALDGTDYMKILLDNGIPQEACSFLQEHIEVDPHHTKMMEGYIKNLVTTDAECELFFESMRKAIGLHYKMIFGALSRPL